MNEVVYIAGPITGVKDYHEAFDKAAKDLRQAGFIPLSPTWQPQGMSNARYMRICLSMIDIADAVLLLPGIEHSTGALLELSYCEYIRKPHSYYITLLKEYLSHDDRY